MESRDGKPFHFVIAHGVTSGPQSRKAVREFWSTLFPSALITEFNFFAEGFDWGNGRLIHRAQALLEAIQSDRKSWRASGDLSGDDIPCVFFSHELGGCLVKQAMVLASQDGRHAHVINDAAILIFCETPRMVMESTGSQHELLRILSHQEPDSCFPLKLLQELPSELEELGPAFATIQKHFRIDEISSVGDRILESVSVTTNSEIADVVNFDGKHGAESALSQSGGLVNNSMKLWKFVPGDPVTEKISELIGASLRGAWQPASKVLHHFLHLLSRIAPVSHRVESCKSFPNAPMWINEHPSYREWQTPTAETPSLVYVHGPQGSGRLAVASHFIAKAHEVADSIVISFSFSKHDIRTQSIATFYASLIRQVLLSRPSLFHLVSAIATWSESTGVWGYNVLRNILLSLLKGAFPTPIFCLIYRAEDCDAFHLNHFVKLLEDYRQFPNGMIKIAIFDRQCRKGLFDAAVEVCHDMDLSSEEWRRASIMQLAGPRIETLAILRPEWAHCKEDLLEKLVDDGSSLFQSLLAVSLLEMGKGTSSRSAVAYSIKMLAPSLEKMYEQALGYFQSEFSIPLLPCLQWILHAVQPLSLKELAVIVALENSKPVTMDTLRMDLPLRIASDLRELYGTIIRVTGLNVHPIHNSLRHVLGAQWKIAAEDPEDIIFSRCFDYLEAALGHIASEIDEGSEKDIYSEDLDGEEFALLPYVVTNWPEQYNRTVKNRSHHTSRVLDLFKDEKKAKAWFNLYERYAGPQMNEYPPLDSPLKIASRFGLVDMAVGMIHEPKGQEDSLRETMNDALMLAAGHGHTAIVASLLAEGAHSSEAACLAANNGFFEIVEALITADPGTVDKPDRNGRTPFVLAAQSGNDKIAAYLLEQGATSNLMALHAAIKTGQSKTVRSLIEADADVSAVDEHGYDAIMMAAEGGFTDVVQLLLERGASVQTQSSNGETALHLAIAHGQVAACEILIPGANLLIETNEGLSPIHLAAREGHLDILRDLIRKSHDMVSQEAVNDMATDVFDKSAGVLSPLQLAADYGHGDVVRELLKYPKYNSEWSHSTALFLAARGGFEDIVANLLQIGVATVINDPDGDNALHCASRLQYPNIVAKLLSTISGTVSIFDVDKTNDLLSTPLHLAAESGRLLTVRILLRHKARLDCVNQAGRSALHIAAARGHKLVTEEILQFSEKDSQGRPDVNAISLQDNDGNTPFTLAIRAGHLEVAKTLRSAWSSTTCTELQGDGNNALHVAVECGNEDLVGFLLEKGWDVNSRGSDSQDTALHIASKAGAVAVVNLLLMKGADVDAEGQDKEKPLHRAVRSPFNQSATIRALMEGKADINVTNSRGETPLWVAAYRGSIEVVEELLKWSPNLEIQDNGNRWTPLHAAYDNESITKMLIESGATLEARDSDGRPPWWLAATWSYKGTIRVYVDAGFDPNLKLPNGETALHAFSKNGDTEMVKHVVSRGSDINAKADSNITPLHLAAYYGRTSTTKYLLDQGADKEVDCEEYGTPLMAAATNRSARTVEILLDAGADMNATSSACNYHTALQVASRCKRRGIIEVLLKRGADVNITGGRFGSALLAAVGNDDKETVELLLDAGADINATSSNCEYHTALQVAARKRSQMIELLLQRGADVNVTGGEFGSALLAAISTEDRRNVELLLDAGADINFTGGPRGTALELAFATYDQEIIDLCLQPERQADVNYVGKGRHPTALLAAIDRGHLPTVERLLSRGADPNLRGPDHTDTPVQAAIRKGRLAIVKKLSEYGAQLFFKDSQGRGALSLAIMWKSTEVLSYLSGFAGVDINEQDANLMTPLMVAVDQGSLDVVRDLLVRKADVNLRDQRGTTALIKAVCLNYGAIVSLLVDHEGTDIFVKDVRGRDALYWSARMSWSDTFNQVLQKVKNTETAPSVYQHAVSAAVASNKYEFARLLLQETQRPELLADENGWTPLYSAQMYRRLNIELLITRAIRDARRNTQTIASLLQHPSRWHLVDMASGLCLQPNDKTTQWQIKPMAPLGFTYYFEVKIEKGGNNPDLSGSFGVGFCEENIELGDNMLGWREGSWGYHGDDGQRFNSATTGRPYGPFYNEGDTIGCGVNFKEEAAFYTKNGEVIGRAFSNIRGKLFPAVSVNLGLVGCSISVKFAGKNGKRVDVFMFKGPYTNSETLREPQGAKDEDGGKGAEAGGRRIERNQPVDYMDDDTDSSTD